MVEPFPVDWPAYSELSSVSPPLTTEELSTFAHETIPNNIPNKKSYYMKKWRKELEGKKALAGSIGPHSSPEATGLFGASLMRLHCYYTFLD